MRTAILSETLIVAISHDEACQLSEGLTIGDRINPLDPEAKVAVRPYSDFDPLYEPVQDFRGQEYINRQRTVRCMTLLFGNMDLEIYVPPEVSRDGFIASELISKEAIEVRNSDYASKLLERIPVNGVKLRFDGGLHEHGFAATR